MTYPTTITAPAGLPFIDIVREFDATPEQVFRAQSDPRLIEQWLGPREYKTRVEEWDCRVGGQYRYVVSAGGAEQAFRGVFHTVEPAKFVIQTFEWEGMPGHAVLESATYERLDNGRTRLSTHSAGMSVEDRDGTIANGMERGAVDSMDRLEELLATL
jgi:uncharacterized protein YndB with AHSA1/START domain